MFLIAPASGGCKAQGAGTASLNSIRHGDATREGEVWRTACVLAEPALGMGLPWVTGGFASLTLARILQGLSSRSTPAGAKLSLPVSCGWLCTAHTRTRVASADRTRRSAIELQASTPWLGSCCHRGWGPWGLITVHVGWH